MWNYGPKTKYFKISIKVLFCLDGVFRDLFFPCLKGSDKTSNLPAEAILFVHDLHLHHPHRRVSNEGIEPDHPLLHRMG
jgi:hypothetical protein